MNSFRRIIVTADPGGGRHADLEFGESGTAWIAIGRGFDGADLWLKGDGVRIDLRLRIRRAEGGIEVRIDRGDDENRWWAPDALPRLAVIIDQASAAATAVAAAGSAPNYQEVTLGRTAI